MSRSQYSSDPLGPGTVVGIEGHRKHADQSWPRTYSSYYESPSGTLVRSAFGPGVLNDGPALSAGVQRGRPSMSPPSIQFDRDWQPA